MARILSVALILVAILDAPVIASTTSVAVPGTSDLWLAGMPVGSRATGGNDSPPAESPVQVSGLGPITAGTFSFSATGLVGHVGPSKDGPDGDGGSTTVDSNPQNGIANITAPYDALLGVFLDDSQPDLSAQPTALYFGQGSLDYTSISPELKQTFFIGDGQNSSGIDEVIFAPDGATRLFLGAMDSGQWSDNSGSFTVNVTASYVPEPGSVPALAILSVTILARRLRRRRDSRTLNRVFRL
jgi:hypothetical protein